MSGWLKKESDEFIKSRTDEKAKRDSIAKSDYWHLILEQLENRCSLRDHHK